MKRTWRWLRCFVVLAVSAGVSWGVFAYVRQQPRCVIHGGRVLHLSDDGSQLLTADHGQVKVWDARSGTLLQTFLEPSDRRGLEMMPDKRQVLIKADKTIAFLDWHNGTVHTVAVPGWRWRQQEQVQVYVSPAGHWVAAVNRPGEGPFCALIDVDERRVTFQGAYEFYEFCGDLGVVVRGKNRTATPILLELRTGETRHQLLPEPADLTLAADGRLLAVWTPRLPDQKADDLNVAHPAQEPFVEVWDLSRRARVFRHEPKPGTSIAAVLSPDGRYLAVFFHSRGSVRLTVFDVASGQERLTVPFDWPVVDYDGDPSFLVDWRFFAFQPDRATGDWLCLIEEFEPELPRPHSKLSMWHLATSRRLWTRPAWRPFYGVRAIPECGMVALFAKQKRLACVDARNGQTVWESSAEHPLQQTSVVEGGHVVLTELLLPPDTKGQLRQWLEDYLPAVFGYAHAFVTVIDGKTGRKRFRLDFALEKDELACWTDVNEFGIRLSPDGSTLLIPPKWHAPEDEQPPPIRCFDVSPQRAWAWAVGSGVATFLVLLLLRSIARRRRSWKNDQERARSTAPA